MHGKFFLDISTWMAVTWEKPVVHPVSLQRELGCGQTMRFFMRLSRDLLNIRDRIVWLSCDFACGIARDESHNVNTHASNVARVVKLSDPVFATALHEESHHVSTRLDYMFVFLFFCSTNFESLSRYISKRIVCLNRLLNLDVDVWVHLNCALWSLEVYETLNGALMNVMSAVHRGQDTVSKETISKSVEFSKNCNICNKKLWFVGRGILI